MKITALTIVQDPQPWKTGDRLIAKFNVEYAGLRIRDCLLIRASRGFLLAQAPRGNRQDDGPRIMDIIDTEVRKAMAAAAHDAFLALGGVESEAA